MNDHDEPAHDEPGTPEPDFDDPGHAWVRDLLGDARGTAPAPAEVTARLDETLAGLQAERAGTASGDTASGDTEAGEPASVVPLRRRLGPRLAVAAAAVIVAATGGVVVAQLGGAGHTGSDSASSGAADSASGDTAPPTGPVTGAAPKALADAALPPLTTASFAADAAGVMRRLAGHQFADSQQSPQALPSTAAGQTPGESPSGSAAVEGQAASKALQAPPVTATPDSLRTDQRAPAATGCVGPAVSGAVTLPATLDGARVALVFRAPTAAGQRVEAWSCDGSRLLADATIGR